MHRREKKLTAPAISSSTLELTNFAELFPIGAL